MDGAVAGEGVAQGRELRGYLCLCPGVELGGIDLGEDGTQRRSPHAGDGVLPTVAPDPDLGPPVESRSLHGVAPPVVRAVRDGTRPRRRGSAVRGGGIHCQRFACGNVDGPGEVAASHGHGLVPGLPRGEPVRGGYAVQVFLGLHGNGDHVRGCHCGVGGRGEVLRVVVLRHPRRGGSFSGRPASRDRVLADVVAGVVGEGLGRGKGPVGLDEGLCPRRQEAAPEDGEAPDVGDGLVLVRHVLLLHPDGTVPLVHLAAPDRPLRGLEEVAQRQGPRVSEGVRRR